MKLIPMLLKEMEEEAITTRKMLERVPEGKYDWKPHPKSMTLGRLANHIAELPTWIAMTLTTDELDFASNPYVAEENETTEGLLNYFENSFEQGWQHLEKASEDELSLNWTLRNGEHIISVRTKAQVLRMTFCQVVHHRAQLGVYLRLLDIPIPGSYGPSADEMPFR